MSPTDLTGEAAGLSLLVGLTALDCSLTEQLQFQHDAEPSALHGLHQALNQCWKWGLLNFQP